MKKELAILILLAIPLASAGQEICGLTVEPVIENGFNSCLNKLFVCPPDCQPSTLSSCGLCQCPCTSSACTNKDNCANGICSEEIYPVYVTCISDIVNSMPALQSTISVSKDKCFNINTIVYGTETGKISISGNGCSGLTIALPYVGEICCGTSCLEERCANSIGRIYDFCIDTWMLIVLLAVIFLLMLGGKR